MAWELKNIAYGWKIGIAAVLTGATIFVADNIRQRIYQRDIVELVLGTHERCLATQYSTNPVLYYVSPPSFVRSWYSNSYETTNVPGDLTTNWTAVLHTNVFTNTIGWRTDRAMMVDLDAKIKALVPYYCDTNTVYDGTTNIVMLTVTGLWASLGIGDGTNQFTRVPEWIGTNGTTNAATYGDYPWRIYREDLEERYKVLNALKIFSPTLTVSGDENWKGASMELVSRHAVSTNSWAESIYVAETNFDGFAPYFNAVGAEGYSWKFYVTNTTPNQYRSGIVRSFGHYCCFLTTNVLLEDASFYIKGNILPPEWGFYMDFYDNGDGFTTNYFTKYTATSNASGFYDFFFGDTNLSRAVWGDVPTANMPGVIGSLKGLFRAYGYVTAYPSEMKPAISWKFQYCTNKYW